MSVQPQEIDNLGQNQPNQDVIKEYQPHKDIPRYEIPASFESEEVGENIQPTQMQLNDADKISFSVPYQSTSKAKGESKSSSSIKPAIFDKLKKQQNNSFYDFNQH